MFSKTQTAWLTFISVLPMVFDTLASIMNSLTVPSSIPEERCSSRRVSVHPDTTKPSHLLLARCPLLWDIEAG